MTPSQTRDLSPLNNTSSTRAPGSLTVASHHTAAQSHTPDTQSVDMVQVAAHMLKDLIPNLSQDGDRRSKASISWLLKDMHNGKFAEGCKISFKNGKQLLSCLDKVANGYEKALLINDSSSAKTLSFRLGGLMEQEQWTWFGPQKYLCIPGKQPECVNDEPLSGDAAWEIESDVAQFASLSVWPVLTRLASLPKHLSNKNSTYAGNTMIGFLPKIKAPEGETHNPNWPGFVQTVLHKTLKRILKPFQRTSKDGYSVDCADGIRQDIVPIFLIITQDLEEQNSKMNWEFDFDQYRKLIH
ncbi:17090_t:CDS:2 [Acaulospora colombiana]|uniref:17090_t:CDS:1 n=1 Tax=Acaulospora colombiana TaxID=27376 RepID=A0ACA9PK06_9GLOM|nr:17090_t:CDS:2 [Acaulospora colombiana]